VTKVRGTLQVVATPIGNRADLSPRAQEVLRNADVIAAEDTRRTLQLLQSFGISRPLVSLYEHNETQRVPQLLERLAAGETVALVSDAGTPLLSDPGFELVRAAAHAGYTVLAIPGPSAVTAALAIAALPAQRFCFEGFLPARAAERRAALGALAHEPRTLVFFEAPHRLLATLTDMAAEFGAAREAVVARELTKLHESVYRGTLAQLLERAGADENFTRGEITLVVAGAPVAAAQDADPATLRRTVDLLLKELPPGRAAALAARLTGATRAAAYALATRGGPGPEADDA
jgi:16S rRNA (cytidine1402-2'-O)-methyltransferase